jgi:predicted Zn-dependent protease
MTKTLSVMMALAVAAPASAQLPGALQKGQQVKGAIDDFKFNDAEKVELGRQISEMLRMRFGVVQDPKVTKYVTLVGLTVARNSPQPALPWQFIVLDSDGINAYAAPGGFVHITRGALGFLQSEGELAGVLGHEVGHVVGNHTIEAIQQGKIVQAGANMTRSQFLAQVADKAFEAIFAGSFSRGDEIDADRKGVEASGKAGYHATAISTFLNRLGERNKGNPDRNGLFASHPDLKERVDKIASAAKSAKLTATALVAPRYTSNISYKPIPMASIATEAAPASAAAKPEEKKSTGLSGLRDRVSGGAQRNATSTTASAGARGVTPDRDAKGGPVKTAVRVTVTDAELETFKKGIA